MWSKQQLQLLLLPLFNFSLLAQQLLLLLSSLLEEPEQKEPRRFCFVSSCRPTGYKQLLPCAAVCGGSRKEHGFLQTGRVGVVGSSTDDRNSRWSVFLLLRSLAVKELRLLPCSSADRSNIWSRLLFLTRDETLSGSLKVSLCVSQVDPQMAPPVTAN